MRSASRASLRRLPGLAALLLLALAVLASCHDGERTRRTPRRVSLAPCRLRGVGVDTLCGTWEVHEDRAARTGRKIRLHLAVVPALARNPEPDPLFILAGGPGQAATELAGVAMSSLARIRRHRDLVFVDQRGTGQSHPLDCRTTRADASLAELLVPEPGRDLLGKCLDSYDADVRLYTTAIAMDDLDEVREALGYERINLYGGSYGTRAGLVYLRQHPERVRAAILDGVAPVGRPLPLFLASDAQRALDLTLGQCEADPSCASAFPELRGQLSTLLAGLDRAPIRARIPHPLTGRIEEVQVARPTFTGLLRASLYTSLLTSLTPLAISRAADGDVAPLVAQAGTLTSELGEMMSWGMFLSVVCAEDMPFAPAEEVRRDGDGTIFRSFGADGIFALCDAWPRGALPDGYRDPVRSDVPVLVLSGELDPVTPPSNGEEVVRHLSRGRHLVVPGTAHGTLGEPCVARIATSFLSRGTADGLDTSCLGLIRRTPFFVSFAGSRP